MHAPVSRSAQTRSREHTPVPDGARFRSDANTEEALIEFISNRWLSLPSGAWPVAVSSPR